jgi:hypothetical protein
MVVATSTIELDNKREEDVNVEPDNRREEDANVV